MIEYREMVRKLSSLDGLYEIKGAAFRRLGGERLCEFLEKKTWIRPDHITVINFFLGGYGIIFLFRNQLAVSAILLLHLVLDNLDGYYARTRKLQSKLGRYIDHVADFILGMAYLMISAAYYGESWMWVLPMMFAGEMFILLGLGLAEDKFPSRIFLVFYVFGWYRLGLIVQFLYQPVSFLVNSAGRRMIRKGGDEVE